MNDASIIIDSVSYDPYFMLNCCPEDSEAQVTKSFRKQAKIWHPDKAPNKKNIEHYKHMFKVMHGSYEYIINRKNNSNLKNYKKREPVAINKNINIPTKSLDNSNELSNFNNEFEKNRVITPNDFGYSVDRITNMDEYDKQSDNLKPYQLFDIKGFNNEDFNKAFEYNHQQTLDENSEVSLGLYHQTTDGFNAYNSGDLNGASSVSSYNGIMIVGDTFGQSGMGYYDTNYSDYKQTFSSAKNPSNIVNVPMDFESKCNKFDIALKPNEIKNKIDLQKSQRKLNNKDSNSLNFKQQEELFLQKQEIAMKQKLENDKELILQYQHLYDKDTITSALENKLLTNKDYVSEHEISRRFQGVNFKN